MFDTEQVIYGEFWASVYQEALKLIAHSSLPLSLYNMYTRACANYGEEVMGRSYSSYVSRRFYPTTSRMDEGLGYHPKGKRRISASSSSEEIARGLISLDIMANA